MVNSGGTLSSHARPDRVRTSGHGSEQEKNQRLIGNHLHPDTLQEGVLHLLHGTFEIGERVCRQDFRKLGACICRTVRINDEISLRFVLGFTFNV